MGGEGCKSGVVGEMVVKTRALGEREWKLWNCGVGVGMRWGYFSRGSRGRGAFTGGVSWCGGDARLLGMMVCRNYLLLLGRCHQEGKGMGWDFVAGAVLEKGGGAKLRPCLEERRL